jgi:hypothetical protein
MFRNAWRGIDEHIARGHVEDRTAKEIPAIAARIDCLMAHTAGIPHNVGYFSVTNGSSLVPMVRPLGDECFGATASQGWGTDVGPQETGMAWFQLVGLIHLS